MPPIEWPTSTSGPSGATSSITVAEVAPGLLERRVRHRRAAGAPVAALVPEHQPGHVAQVAALEVPAVQVQGVAVAEHHGDRSSRRPRARGVRLVDLDVERDAVGRGRPGTGAPRSVPNGSSRIGSSAAQRAPDREPLGRDARGGAGGERTDGQADDARRRAGRATARRHRQRSVTPRRPVYVRAARPPMRATISYAIVPGAGPVLGGRLAVPCPARTAPPRRRAATAVVADVDHELVHADPAGDRAAACRRPGPDQCPTRAAGRRRRSRAGPPRASSRAGSCTGGRTTRRARPGPA